MRSLDFTTLLVDPPRAGLDPQTVQLLRDFQSVVYISCNPGEGRGSAARGWGLGEPCQGAQRGCVADAGPAQPRLY